MKKTQKALFLLFCGALCVVFVTCTSGPSIQELPRYLLTGEWFAYNDESDGGDSTSILEAKEEVIDGETVTTYTVHGNVTTKFQYGFAGWGLEPDEISLERIKAAQGFSFKILGDGKRYSLKFKTSDVKDFAYHEYIFATVAGEVSTMEVPIRFFIQPSWSNTPVRLRQENVIGVEFQTHESWRPGTFEVKVWDIMVYN